MTHFLTHESLKQLFFYTATALAVSWMAMEFSTLRFEKPLVLVKDQSVIQTSMLEQLVQP